MLLTPHTSHSRTLLPKRCTGSLLVYDLHGLFSNYYELRDFCNRCNHSPRRHSRRLWSVISVFFPHPVFFCSTIVPKCSAVSANSSIGFWIVRNRRPRRQDDSSSFGAFPSSHCCQLDTFSTHVFFRFVCLDISTYLWVGPIRMQRSNKTHFLWSKPSCIRLWQIPQPHYLGCFDTLILLPNTEKLYHDFDCHSGTVLLHGQSSATQTKGTSQE